jgi:hypothetical protein
MNPATFSSQAKEQAAVRADTEDMKRALQEGSLFATCVADRTRLSFAALSMRSLWNSRAKKQDRARKEPSSKAQELPRGAKQNDEGTAAVN